MDGANPRHLGQNGGRIEQHPARAQHQRLDDKTCRIVARAKTLQRVIGRLLGPGMGEGHGVDGKEQRLIGGIVNTALADAHRADRVAVIGMLHHGDALALPLPQMAPMAQRHFQRDLDAGGAGIGEEGVGQAGDAHQALRDILRGLMRPSSKDQLIQLARLLGNRAADGRIGMAMRRHPPTGNRIDDAVALGGIEARPLGPRDQGDGFAKAMLGERMPDGRARHRSNSAMAAASVSGVTEARRGR